MSDNEVDYFADDDLLRAVISARIHIFVQQRTGRQKITIIENISAEDEPRKLLLTMKQKFGCGGHIEAGNIILNGDHRNEVVELLAARKIASRDEILVHGP